MEEKGLFSKMIPVKNYGITKILNSGGASVQNLYFVHLCKKLLRKSIDLYILRTLQLT